MFFKRLPRGLAQGLLRFSWVPAKLEVLLNRCVSVVAYRLEAWC